MSACIVCRTKSNLESIEKYRNKFSDIVGFEIRLTASLCTKCVHQLVLAHNFRNKARQHLIEAQQLHDPVDDGGFFPWETMPPAPNGRSMLHVGCPYCFRRFHYIKELLPHVEAHVKQNGGLECHYCGMKCPTKSQLLIHLNKLHKSKKPIRTAKKRIYINYDCQICNKKLAKPGNLKRHMETVHSKDNEKVITDFEEVIIKAPPLEEDDEENMVEEHLEILDDFEIDEETQEVVPHKPRNPSQSSVKKYPCDICGKSFRKIYLAKHYEGHKTEEFYCDECGKRFKNETRFKLHECGVQSKSVPVVKSCEICGKKFSGKNYDKHKGSHDLQCTICKKVFSKKFNLTAHMRLHTDDLFSCEKCPQRFATNHHLKKHVVRYHTNSTGKQLIIF